MDVFAIMNERKAGMAIVITALDAFFKETGNNYKTDE